MKLVGDPRGATTKESLYLQGFFSNIEIYCMQTMKKYVLTGGPSVGKTTLIRLLAECGYGTVSEAADDIIKEERAKPNGGVLGAHDVYRFQEIVAERQLKLEEAAVDEIVFLDRGVVDGYGYCKYAGVEVPSVIVNNGRGRYDKVFILDSLGAYEYDGVRTGSLEKANAIIPFIKNAYEFFGYKPISVPVLGPEKRLAFILTTLQLSPPAGSISN